MDTLYKPVPKNRKDQENIPVKQGEGQNYMRTAVITAPREIELQTALKPEPAADEVLIHLQGCGLCISDLPVWQGREWFSYPVSSGNPGHEGWGVVEAVGENVKTVKPGYRVAALCYNAYAEYDTAKENQVVELPENLHDKPFPAEPLACAMNIFRRCRIRHGQTVAIVGTGWMGLLLMQLVKKAGARVIAISRRQSSLKHALKAGADYLFSVNEDDQLTQSIEELTNGRFCDCVIEAAGNQESLNLAGILTGVRGRLVIAGYHQDGVRQVNMQLWNWRGIDVINAHERDPDVYRRGMNEAVKYVSMGVLNPFPLLTHTFPFEQIQSAFEICELKPEGFTKALISFE